MRIIKDVEHAHGILQMEPLIRAYLRIGFGAFLFIMSGTLVATGLIVSGGLYVLAGAVMICIASMLQARGVREAIEWQQNLQLISKAQDEPVDDNVSEDDARTGAQKQQPTVH